jgi:hypothetical protein
VVEPKKAKKKALATEASAPAPPPKPGEPGYDWSQDYAGEKVFVYETLDGKQTVGLAGVGVKRKFKPGEIRKARHMSEMDQMFMVIERVASPNALTVSDEFSDEDYSEMFRKWSEWANTSPGES